MKEVVVQPPAAEAPATANRILVLVVAADCFALTSRVDPNVYFWEPGYAKSDTKLPEGITHLWVSPYVPTEVKENLIRQAKSRRNDPVVVWDCVLGELKSRLLPLWGYNGNRSMIRPLEPDENPEKIMDETLSFSEGATVPSRTINSTTLGDLTSKQWELGEEPEEEFPFPSRRESAKSKQVRTAVSRRKDSRLELLRQAGARHRGADQPQSARPVPASVPAARPVTSELESLKAALAQMSSIDRTVFQTYYRLNGHPGPIRDLEATASETKLPASNILRTVDRVWAKLKDRGIDHNEQSLLEVLDRKDQAEIY